MVGAGWWFQERTLYTALGRGVPLRGGREGGLDARVCALPRGRVGLGVLFVSGQPAAKEEGRVTPGTVQKWAEDVRVCV